MPATRPVHGNERPFSPDRVPQACYQRALVEHLVDQPVVLGLVGRHAEVTLHVGGDLLERLAGALGIDAVELLARLEDLARLDLDVGGLALRAARGLVDHDARVGQRDALALGAGHQQERAHAGGHAHAQRGHVGLDELHGVEDRQARR